MAIVKNGSNWSKWDLHIHTPYTRLNSQYSVSENEDLWDRFCKEIEESDVSVFGITDYFSVENYFVFIEKFNQKYPQSKKVFFPNIELRLDVSVNKEGEEVNIHVIFSDKARKDDIEAFLARLPTNITNNGSTKNCSQLIAKDFQKAGIKYLDIRETLIDVFGNNECYLIFAAANNQGLRPTKSPRKLNISDEIDKLCDGFIGGSKNVEFYLNDERYELTAEGTRERAKICPVISGSDSHSFDDIQNKLGKEYRKVDGKGGICDSSEITWIKADTTFEGLRQIIYEPKERVHIGENKPSENLQKISKVAIHFDDEIRISRSGSNTESYPFCFAGVRQELYLSDYFNCFIGGRGSGKSSLLNLLYKRVGGGDDTDFLKQNKLKRENDDIVIENNIDVDFSSEKVEFLGQNQIEEFATNYEKFSNAIYDRLENFEQLEKYNKELTAIIGEIELIIGDIQDVSETNERLSQFKKDLDAYNKIIDVIKGEKYKEIRDSIKKKQDEVNVLRVSKDKYERLKNDIQTLTRGYVMNNAPANDYDQSYNALVERLAELKNSIDEKKFDTTLEERLLVEYEGLKKGLSDYLIEKGISQEKLNDLNKAQDSIKDLEVEIPKLELSSKEFTERIGGFSLGDVSKVYGEYRELVSQGLKGAEGRLGEIKNDNIGEIKFEILIDRERLNKDLFEEFTGYFQQYKTDKYHSDKLYEILFQIEPIQILDGTKSYEDLLEIAKAGNNNGYFFLQKVFEKEINFQIYKMLVAKHCYNLRKYLKIGILYNGRPIENSSFGQKCTVVILIMILFGTKPIIIDEPEAHLDSSLIADYLVDLIKQRKKERQIIFATHNANFVINGDAEQIYILEMNDNKTSFTQTTIEDLGGREKLLRLEGGKKAFELRERKYHF